MIDITKLIIIINSLDTETKTNICASVYCFKGINCDACPLTNLYEKEELDEWYNKSNN